MALKNIVTPLDGYKTWIAIVGAFALGVYQLCQGDYQTGVTSLLAAFGLLGALHRIERKIG